MIEFALDTKGENGTAAALGLLDLKSYTLAFLLEEMGLANPERFVWGLRGRFVFGGPTTNYSVVQLNYDPVTIQPTPFVNGVRYNYQIFDDLGPVGGGHVIPPQVHGALAGLDVHAGSPVGRPPVSHRRSPALRA